MGYNYSVIHCLRFQQGRYEGPPKPQDHEKPFYPKYDEYEVMPGEHEFSKKDKWADFKNPYAENDKGSSR